jgi:hypothetical protein
MHTLRIFASKLVVDLASYSARIILACFSVLDGILYRRLARAAQYNTNRIESSRTQLWRGKSIWLLKWHRQRYRYVRGLLRIPVDLFVRTSTCPENLNPQKPDCCMPMSMPKAKNVNSFLFSQSIIRVQWYTIGSWRRTDIAMQSMESF